MNLYIVRHAEAEALGGGIDSDFNRPLTTRGKSDAQLMAQAVHHVDARIRHIFTSPLLRAVETGEIFGKELKRSPETSRWLSPGFSPSALAETILSQSNDAGVMVIGHQPDMSIFIAHLISPVCAATVDMVTCAVACLEVEGDNSAHLRWLMTPDMVGKMSVVSPR
ncbi:MAG: phosphohistidine phosphatase SixA [bacterium]